MIEIPPSGIQDPAYRIAKHLKVDFQLKVNLFFMENGDKFSELFSNLHQTYTKADNQ